MTVFTRIADGSESGNVTVTIAGDTNNSCRGTIHRFTKSQSSYTWDVVCHGGADSTSGTGFSVTAGAAISFAPGDHLLIAVSQRVDSATQSAQSITASGITFGTRTNRATTAVTTGHDHRHVVDTVPVSSGSASVAPVWAYTASAACSGGCVFVRLREIPPTADVAQVSFFEFEVPQGSGASSVSADLDARWALLNTAQADADLRWGLLNAAQSDLDARWSILAGVQSDADLRWQVLAALSAVQADIDLRWSAIAAAQADLEMQWQAAGSVNADLDARWALLNAAQAELDARWGLLTSAQADADLRWSALAAIEADADLRWSIGQVVVLARPHGTQHQNTRPAAHSSSRPRALANGRRPH